MEALRKPGQKFVLLALLMAFATFAAVFALGVFSAPAQAQDMKVVRGAFTLSTTDEGGLVENTDYRYEGTTLTITTEKPVTVGMSDAAKEEIEYLDANGFVEKAAHGTTTDNIVVAVAENETAHVTFDNVVIDQSDNGSAAVLVQSGSLDLTTLEGTSVLKSGERYAGLHNQEQPLSISCDGFLNTSGGESAAGIGGGYGGSGSNIRISSGYWVVARGGVFAAGIGGGEGGSGSDIEISGGQVSAWGGALASGIGGGYGGSGSNIRISCVQVGAFGGSYAAGIGGGYGRPGSNIRILDGVVIARGGVSGAGVGGGFGGPGSNIVVSGGSLYAVGGDRNEGPYGGAAGIGGGYRASGSTSVVISGGEVDATGGLYAAGIGGGYETAGSVGIEISGGQITANAGEDADAAIGDGLNKQGDPAEVSIIGGVFADGTSDDPSLATEVYGLAPAEGYVVYANDDESSNGAYPLAVGRDPVLSLKDSVVYSGSAVSVSDVASVSDDAAADGVEVSVRYRPVDADGDAWTDGTPSAAGVYEVQMSAGSAEYAAGADGARWAAVTRTGTFTVERRSLTVTADDIGVVYGADVPVYSVTVEGWAGGDGDSLGQTLLAALAFDCGYAKGSPVTAAGYTVTPKWADGEPAALSNYAVEFKPGILTVSPVGDGNGSGDKSQEDLTKTGAGVTVPLVAVAVLTVLGLAGVALRRRG